MEKAKKSLGQNFLKDESIIQRILDSNPNLNNSLVIEIGPGRGALTRKLVASCAGVLAYELDKDLIQKLKDEFKDNHNVVIIDKDFLQADVEKDIYNNKNLFNSFEDIKVIANIPYYITSPILKKIIKELPFISSYTLMMQEEVALRICAEPHHKEYGALSVIVQTFSNPKYLFKVLPTSFYPAPKVNSAVVRGEILKDNDGFIKKIDQYESFVEGMFSQKRKTLANNLKNSFKSKDAFEVFFLRFNLPPNIRAEELNVDTIKKMYEYYSSERELIKAYAKVNLYLDVLKKDDEFHQLEAINSRVDLYDLIEIKEGKQNISYSLDELNNLEYDLIKELVAKFIKENNLPQQDIYIYKNIPVGAGLGGASSDAAAILSYLNDKYNLKLSKEELMNYCYDYGKDIPYMFLDSPAYVRGYGEILEEVDLELNEDIYLIMPQIHVATKDAFKELSTIEHNPLGKDECVRQVEEEKFYNIFESNLKEQYNLMDQLFKVLKRYGNAVLSGSGATIVFFKDSKVNQVFIEEIKNIDDKVIIKKVNLLKK